MRKCAEARFFARKPDLRRNAYLCKNELSMQRNIAAILAGGRGSRAGFGEPKQFAELCGRTVLERAVDAFESNGGISGIIVVTGESHIARVREMARRNVWRKPLAVVPGGAERSGSVIAAIEACSGADCNILLHDAARPLVSQRIISAVCAALECNAAVGVAVPSADSLFEADGGRMLRPVDRACVWRAQTPQAFRLSVIAEAYRRAAAISGFSATDDCAVVMKCLPDVEIAVVRGEEENFKLTYAGDAARMEDIIRRRGI